jgi:hypothetical protein
MKKFKVLITSFLCFYVTSVFAAPYNCVDINLLTVDKENANTKALKRASHIPNEVLELIQQIVIDEVDLDDNGLKSYAVDLNKTCPDTDESLVVNGEVIDYKKGNRAVRYMVGFGAGKQKIETNLVLSVKKSGEVLAKERVVDRKIGGLVGGSEDKGKRDYAEKVNKFIRKAIGLSK